MNVHSSIRMVTHYLLVSSADNICKQIEVPRSGWTFCQAGVGSNLFDTQMLFLKEFIEKNIFLKKNPLDKKAHEKFPWVHNYCNTFF